MKTFYTLAILILSLNVVATTTQFKNKALKSEYLIDFVEELIALELNLELDNGEFYDHRIIQIKKGQKGKVLELTISSHVDYDSFNPEFGDPMIAYDICTSVLRKDKNGKYQEKLSTISCVADPEADPNYIDFNDFYGYDQD